MRTTMTSIRNRVFKRSLVPIVIAILAATTIATYVFAMPLLTSGPLKTSPELITLDHYTIATDSGQQNPTVLTLWLRNDGASTTTLSTISVHDENPSTSPVTFQLSGTTISPGTTKSITVDTLGSGLYFSHGILYQVSLVTSRAIMSYSIHY